MSGYNRPIRVGLIIDEFFGGANTAFGGYGFLARNHIAKYIPNADIQIDVLLGKGS
nr:glycosyl transferase [Acinetobacter baumannii]